MFDQFENRAKMVHLLNEHVKKSVCFIRNYSIDESRDFEVIIYENDTVEDLLNKVSERCQYSVDVFSLVNNQMKCSIENKDLDLQKMGFQFGSDEKTILKVVFKKDSASEMKNGNGEVLGALNVQIDCDNNNNTSANRNSFEDDWNCNDEEINEEVVTSTTTISAINNNNNNNTETATISNKNTRSNSVSYNKSKIRNHDSTNDGYVGLVNQAMTCYLNSLLQSLFMTPEFRNNLYMWQYNGPSDKKQKTIAYQLQKLFVNLQTSEKVAVHTNDLTSSFGWTSNEAWQQHDIQELCRVMFDALEQNFANTPQRDLINRLYEGKMLDCIKCEQCQSVKSREDIFLDIPLQVRRFGSSQSFKDIKESLRDFIEPEILNGTNQYFCEKCNKKCDAKKALVFKKLPYILTLHLKRFDYDFHTANRIKINDVIKFPFYLDLSEFVGRDENILNGDSKNGQHSVNSDLDDYEGSGASEEKRATMYNKRNCRSSMNTDSGSDTEHNSTETQSRTKTSTEYDLFSIMIHSGSANGGHYYVYIKNFVTDQWYSFNDQTVSRISKDDVRRTYGLQQKSPYTFAAASGSAYMLFYRCKNPENERFLDKNDLPSHLQQMAEEIRQAEELSFSSNYDQNSMLVPYIQTEPDQMSKNVYYRINDTLHHKKMQIYSNWSMNEIKRNACKLIDLDHLNVHSPVRLVAFNNLTKKMKYSFENWEYESFSSLSNACQWTDEKVDFFLEFYESKLSSFEQLRPIQVQQFVKIIQVLNDSISKEINVKFDEIDSKMEEYLAEDCFSVYYLKRNQSNIFKRIRSFSDLEGIKNTSNAIFYVFQKEHNEHFVKQLCLKLENSVSFFIKIPIFSEHDLAAKSIPLLSNSENKPHALTNGYTNGYASDIQENNNDNYSHSNGYGYNGTQTNNIMNNNNNNNNNNIDYDESNKENMNEIVDCFENEKDKSSNYLLTIIKPPGLYKPDERVYKVTASKNVLIGLLKKKIEQYVCVQMKYYKISRGDDECHDNETVLDAVLCSNDSLSVQINRQCAENEIFSKIFYLNMENDEKFVYVCEWYIKVNETIGSIKSQILKRFSHLANQYGGLTEQNCHILLKAYKSVSGVLTDNRVVCESDLVLQSSCELCLQRVLLEPQQPIRQPKQILIYMLQWKPSILQFGSVFDIVFDLGEVVRHFETAPERGPEPESESEPKRESESGLEAELVSRLQINLESISKIPKDLIVICAFQHFTKQKASLILQKKWSDSDLKQFSELCNCTHPNPVFFMLFKDNREKDKVMTDTEMEDLRRKDQNLKLRTSANSRRDKSLRIHVEL